MDEWIQILVAFVHSDEEYIFKTRNLNEMIVATPHAAIEVQNDTRWAELVELGKYLLVNEETCKWCVSDALEFKCMSYSRCFRWPK